MNKRQFDQFNQSNKENQNKNVKQKKSNLKPLLFTFLGTFIVFFFAFTVLLPILTPQVEIPALTDEHSMSSVNSNDFKGRIDPRLKAIEEQENAPPPKLKMELPAKTETQTGYENTPDEQIAGDNSGTYENQEPQNSIPGENNDQDYNYNIEKQMPDETAKPVKPQPVVKTIDKSAKPATMANIPPRPQVIPQPQAALQNNNEVSRPATTKVVLGSYATPMQARLVSDTLVEMDLNIAPFIKERNGRYILQVGSFSDPSKAEGLVQELKNKGFNASTLSE